MKIEKIGVVSPGDMGQGVAMRLKACGYEVYTPLAGRSERTVALARQASLVDCGTVAEMLATCDTVLSILNPGAALEKAREIGAAMRTAGKRVTYVDCNAIAPQTVHEIDRVIREAGGVFIDAGIIGPPPRGKLKTKLYVSGPAAAELAQIADPQLQIRIVSDRIGDASAVKMCYAALTKGSIALGMELLIAARKLGVDKALEAEFQESQSQMYDSLLSRSVSMPPKAHRWVPEMLEIAKTFQDAGLTPRMLQGAADMYELIAETALGRESPEEARKHARGGAAIVQGLADGL